MLLSEILFLTVFFSPIESAEDLIMIQKIEQQIQKLQQLVDSSEAQEAEVREIRGTLAELLGEIDKSLKPHLETKEFHEALLAVQRKELENRKSSPSEIDNRLKELKEKISEKPDEESSYQYSALRANEADLREIERLEKDYGQVSVAETQAFTYHSSLNTWKGLVRLSSQLAAMLNELEKVHSELEYKRLREEQLSKEEQEILEDSKKFFGFQFVEGNSN